MAINSELEGYTVDDTEPPAKFSIEEDISLQTITLRLIRPDDTEQTISATVTQAVPGPDPTTDPATFEFDWTTASLTIAGTYDLKVIFTLTSDTSRVETFSGTTLVVTT